jgi:hypothetical protein
VGDEMLVDGIVKCGGSDTAKLMTNQSYCHFFPVGPIMLFHEIASNTREAESNHKIFREEMHGTAMILCTVKRLERAETQ